MKILSGNFKILFSSIFVLSAFLLFTKNIFAESTASMACESNRSGLAYAPEIKELIVCKEWKAWKRFKVLLKPKKFISDEQEFAEGPIYGNEVVSKKAYAESTNLYYLMKPVISSSGTTIPLTHSAPESENFIQAIVNIDVGPRSHYVTWSGGCISAYSESTSLPNCIFKVSSSDLLYISNWVKHSEDNRIFNVYISVRQR